MPFLSSLSSKNKWIALFSLWTLHGVMSLWQYFALSSKNHKVPFDLTYVEALVAGLLIFWVLLNLFLIFSMSRGSLWLVRSLDLLKGPVVKDSIFIVAALALFVRICLAILQALADPTAHLRFVAYIDRLSPVLNLMTFVWLEIILLNIFFAFRENMEYQKWLKTIFAKLWVVLLLLGLTTLYISLTRMGIMPNYQGDWARGVPAVPLLEWQIILACILCVGMVILESKQRIVKIPHLDLWIGLAVWLIAVALWLGQPVVPNASALGPRAPNFEVYPFNDAETYDEISQSVLIGDGFGVDNIPPRPLYIVFLTFMHVSVGQNYNNVIALQSVFFALFPVLLYFFGKQFFGRPIGISIALLAILRDYTSNLVSPFTGNLTYSKLYLSEIPTAMLLVLFLLVGMRWIKSGFPVYSGFLLGGILGIAMLIRAQVVVAFPMLLVFALIAHPSKIKLIAKNTLVALVTILMVISPWLWRNWKMTGQLVFEDPVSQMANLALRYNRLNGVHIANMPLPGEASSDYNVRLSELTAQAIRLNPLGIVKAIANSFLNHGVNNILVFPLRNKVRDYGELWTPTKAFWEGWAGRPTLPQRLLLAFYIFLFGLGVSVAWQRSGWLGFLPLGVNLIYNLSTSVALLSGQRFMFTMDWSVYLYYTIGLFALISILLFALESGRSMIVNWYEANRFSTIEKVDRKNLLPYIFAGILFFGIGGSLPLSERIFPQRYPQVPREAVLNQPGFVSALKQSKLESTCIQNILDQEQLSMVRGLALYPRFYKPGAGESFTDAAGYKTADEGRLVFEMVGQINQRVVFPMPEQPDFFPNASDVTLFMDANGDPWFVLVEQGDDQRIYFSESLVSSMCNEQH